MTTIVSLEEERSQYLEQLDLIQSQLKDDTDNTELIALRDELKQMIALLEESMAELNPKQAVSRPSQHSTQAPSVTSQQTGTRNAPAPPPPDALPESRDAFAAPAHAPPPPPYAPDDDAVAAPPTYKVNDTIMARWISGDKGFYTARITSIVGSSTAPVYIVKFKSYDETETVRPKDIRPISNKRKADGSPVTTSSSTSAPTSVPRPPTSQGSTIPGIISAAASLYPQVTTPREADVPGEDVKPPKPKKIKAKKELEAGKARWQDFNAKSKFNKTKKDSMFRTPDGVHGRVGFTGSGQAMRKDPSRTRHVHQQGDDLD
jgi:survival-of-motor-neuron-related-splicing factor 30